MTVATRLASQAPHIVTGKPDKAQAAAKGSKSFSDALYVGKTAVHHRGAQQGSERPVLAEQPHAPAQKQDASNSADAIAPVEKTERKNEPDADAAISQQIWIAANLKQEAHQNSLSNEREGILAPSDDRSATSAEDGAPAPNAALDMTGPHETAVKETKFQGARTASKAEVQLAADASTGTPDGPVAPKTHPAVEAKLEMAPAPLSVNVRAEDRSNGAADNNLNVSANVRVDTTAELHPQVQSSEVAPAPSSEEPQIVVPATEHAPPSATTPTHTTQPDPTSNLNDASETPATTTNQADPSPAIGRTTATVELSSVSTQPSQPSTLVTKPPLAIDEPISIVTVEASSFAQGTNNAPLEGEANSNMISPQLDPETPHKLIDSGSRPTISAEPATVDVVVDPAEPRAIVLPAQGSENDTPAPSTMPFSVELPVDEPGVLPPGTTDDGVGPSTSASTVTAAAVETAATPIPQTPSEPEQPANVQAVTVVGPNEPTTATVTFVSEAMPTNRPDARTVSVEVTASANILTPETVQPIVAPSIELTPTTVRPQTPPAVAPFEEIVVPNVTLAEPTPSMEVAPAPAQRPVVATTTPQAASVAVPAIATLPLNFNNKISAAVELGQKPVLLRAANDIASILSGTRLDASLREADRASAALKEANKAKAAEKSPDPTPAPAPAVPQTAFPSASSVGQTIAEPSASLADIALASGSPTDADAPRAEIRAAERVDVSVTKSSAQSATMPTNSVTSTVVESISQAASATQAPSNISNPHLPGHRPDASVPHQLTIQLHPGELGVVTAVLRRSGDQLSVELSVEKSEAYQRLSADSDTIIKALRGLGLQVDQITIQQPQIATQGAVKADGNLAPQTSPGRDQQFAQTGSQNGNGSGQSGGRSNGDSQNGSEPRGAIEANRQSTGNSGIYI